MSKEQIDAKNCKECLHFEACCKWTDFPKQIGSPVCGRFTPTNTPTNTPTKSQFTNPELKQIEEMAKAICGLNTSDGCFCDGGYCNYNCLSYEKAENLYKQGYRKQVEGKWKQSAKWESDYSCSVCGEYAIEGQYGGNYDVLTKYCPNCGAKMKGGAE